MKWKTEQIHMRDPFVLTVPHEKCYYLYGTTDVNCWDETYGRGFDCYRGTDLVNWEGPFAAFTPPENFWATGNFWAPEVHEYQGKYFLFASFKAPGRRRGVQILSSDSPKGPFKVHSPEPVTPHEWECLDGTFYLDDNGQPWMVFCHEWVQISDGSMCAVRLAPDLRSTVGEIAVLFHASEAPWVKAIDAEQTKFVTDGPFLYREDGKLKMLWSSNGNDGYAMGVAVSENGSIDGKWRQIEKPVFSQDGGHGMRFTAMDGKTMLSVHRPNRSPDEHPFFWTL